MAAEIDFAMHVFPRDPLYERSKVDLLPLKRLDYDSAGLFANVDGIIDVHVRGLQDGGGNSDRSALSPFLDGGLHWVPCICIVSVECQGKDSMSTLRATGIE